MSLIGATITSLWLYNILNLRKTVIGAIDYVYNGPSQCLNDNICEKSIPNFLLLYIASVSAFLHCLVASQFSFPLYYFSGGRPKYLLWCI